MVAVIVAGENINDSIRFFWVFSETAVTLLNTLWIHFLLWIYFSSNFKCSRHCRAYTVFCDDDSFGENNGPQPIKSDLIGMKQFFSCSIVPVILIVAGRLFSNDSNGKEPPSVNNVQFHFVPLANSSSGI
jgi:hypothetical protein